MMKCTGAVPLSECRDGFAHPVGATVVLDGVHEGSEFCVTVELALWP